MCHHWTYDHEPAEEYEEEPVDEEVAVPVEEPEDSEREDDPLADVPTADD